MRILAALVVGAAVALAGCSTPKEPETGPAITVEPPAPPTPSEPTTEAAPTKESEAPVESSSPSETSAAPETVTPPPHARPVVGSIDDAALAREIALEKVPGGTVIAQDLEDMAGVWEVHVALGREVHELHVHTGERRVTLDEVDTLDGDDARALDAGMTIDEAIRLAAAEAPGTITDVQFDDGRWEVDIDTDDGRELDLAVDPTSGRVTGIS